jgi:hypothetical protein
VASGKWQVASVSFVTKAVDGGGQDAIDFFRQPYTFADKTLLSGLTV